MKLIVLGAGIAGVSTAWYLASEGHDVTVIDRAEDVAMETSFANAGQLSYGYTTPWAAPGIPLKALKWMFKQHSPLIFQPDGSLFQIRWLKQMLDNCTAERYQINKERMVRISEYSREMFRLFKEQENIDFEGRNKGTLQIFRTQKEVAAAEKDIAVLERYGVPLRRLKPEECLEFEPALHHALPKIAGGLHLPADATGDCRLFTRKLRDLCIQKGVRFEFGHHIRRIIHDRCRITAVETDQGQFEADAFVCALGCFSRTVLEDLGWDLPIDPVKGYSLTLPVVHDEKAPVSTVLDETYKVAITRFDKRIRVGGMAELSGYGLHLSEKRRATLALVVNDLFPGGGDLQQAEFWSGLRPMTPDSTPLIGKTPLENLFLNTGHGTLGWTMSLGSAKLTADVVCGKETEIGSDDLGLSRYTKV